MPIRMTHASPEALIIGCVVMLLNSSGMEQELNTNTSTIWGLIVYIINGRVTRNNFDDRSHRCYCMGYETTTGVIIYWNTDQHFIIQRAHHIWFDEYNYCISIEYKHNIGFSPLQKYPESIIHNSDLLNLIPCKPDITSTTYSDTTISNMKLIHLPLGKVSFNLLNDEYFTIPYITDTIPNSPGYHQLTTRSKRNMWIIAINVE